MREAKAFLFLFYKNFWLINSKVILLVVQYFKYYYQGSDVILLKYRSITKILYYFGSYICFKHNYCFFISII